MKDTSEVNQQPQYLSPESPGQRLRQAREAAGLSRGEVALHMRINESKVAALEEDNYDVFPSETFVSGYLRSYAKVLGLPEGDFVRPVSSTQLPPELTPASGDKKQASSMDLPVRMVTYVIIVVVIVSIAMWWISQREKGAEKTVAMQEESSQVVDSEAATPPAAAVEEADTDTVMAGDEAVTAPDADMNVSSEPVSDEQVVVHEEAALPVASPQQTSVQTRQQDPAVPPLVVSPTVPTEAQTGETSDDTVTAAPPLTDDTPRSMLVLEYQSDSWTEVDDNAGRRLVYGLMRAGQTIELKGEAPFNVFLGYAEGVTIHYNNELFEHSSFQRGEVARFRIGRVEHNQPAAR